MDEKGKLESESIEGMVQIGANPPSDMVDVETAVHSITSAEGGDNLGAGQTLSITNDGGSQYVLSGDQLGERIMVTDDGLISSSETPIIADANLSQGGVILTADQLTSLMSQAIPVTDQSALQTLQASPTTETGDAMLIAVAGNGALQSGKIWQVVPTADNPNLAALVAVNQSLDIGGGLSQDQNSVVVLEPLTDNSMARVLMPPPTQHLPPGCPTWAARLKDCEKIGDAYRGWVENEVELDLLLTYHKQQTQSFWGTRQSPSPAKQSTRLMWKSQYAPFDGIPFVNSGSRAIVMECQYGPRRKGLSNKGNPGSASMKPNFKQTCPARIYVKKVKKFVEYALDLSQDKKTVKTMMDKAFNQLKEQGFEGMGQERFYVQLPTENAHEFHSEAGSAPAQIKREEPTSRMHPRIRDRIRDMVAGGETRLYVIRKALRRFVERELFNGTDPGPEKHNLSYYPTVNDLQNHISQALKDIEKGVLPLTAHTVNLEVITSDESNKQHNRENIWRGDGMPHTETVTVTLTQNPKNEGHIISRVETHLSDGTTQISDTLTPETAQLLAKLHPSVFAAGNMVQLTDVSNAIQESQGGVNLVNRRTLQTTNNETPDGIMVSPPMTSSLAEQEMLSPAQEQMDSMDQSETTGEERLLVKQDNGEYHIVSASQLASMQSQGLEEERDILSKTDSEDPIPDESVVSVVMQPSDQELVESGVHFQGMNAEDVS